jgi:cation transport ATPase
VHTCMLASPPPHLPPAPLQVISVLHHRFRGHVEDETYVPTDFFETAAMIITLILMGKYLECAAKVRAVLGLLLKVM